MQPNYIALGKRIKEKRKALGLTQAQLSEKAEIEPTTLSHIERAATKVSLPTLIMIANALNATLDELVFDSLIKSKHIQIEQVNELLSDCTGSELKALSEILSTAKTVLRNYNQE